MDEVASLMCYVYLSVAARQIAQADPCMRSALYVAWKLSKQPKNDARQIRIQSVSLLSVQEIHVCRKLPSRALSWLSSLLVGWLLNIPSKHVSVSRGRVCPASCMCCHTAGEICLFTHSRYTDTGPASPCNDPITQDAWVATGVLVFKALV